MVLEGNVYRLVGGFKAVNQQSESLAAPLMIWGEQASTCAEAVLFKVVSPLRALLERKQKDTTRTKRVASRKVISKENWTEEFQAAW